MSQDLTAEKVSKDKESVSYSLGLSIGNNLKSQNLTDVTFNTLAVILLS